MNEFFNNNKVFILGLLASIAVGLQELTVPDPSLKVIGFAVFSGALSFIANQWRGRGMSLVGIIGNLAGVYLTIQETGEFTWTQFMVQAIIAILAASSPDPKSVGYERSDLIKSAKIEGEQIQPASLTKKYEDTVHSERNY